MVSTRIQKNNLYEKFGTERKTEQQTKKKTKLQFLCVCVSNLSTFHICIPISLSLHPQDKSPYTEIERKKPEEDKETEDNSEQRRIIKGIRSEMG